MASAVSAPKIISVSILHRHGARGPGASEIAPWEGASSAVTGQWHESELEELTSVGHEMIVTLGTWFAEKYGKNDPKVLFRCSKSGRAKESGVDFINGFNKAITKTENLVSAIPIPFINNNININEYNASIKVDEIESSKVESKEDGKIHINHINEDYFFRPWKIYKKLIANLKIDTFNNTDYKFQCEKNAVFLRDIYTISKSKNEFIENSMKALWSCSHLYALLDCEKYWPVAEEKKAMTHLIPVEMRDKIEELACHVWDHRFLRSDCVVEMGAHMCLEILQKMFDAEHDINIFSGHDYTILSVIGSLQLRDSLSHAPNFGCYMIFELWDDTPPAHTSSLDNNGSLVHERHDITSQATKNIVDGSNNDAKKDEISNSCYHKDILLCKPVKADTRILRILHNPCPIDVSNMASIDVSNETLLAEYNMEELELKYKFLYNRLSEQNMSSFEKNLKSDKNEKHHEDNDR